MAHDPDVPVFRIGPVTVADLDMAGLVASMRRFLAGGRTRQGTYIAFCGAHGVVESETRPAVRDAHENSWLTVADGRPLYWFGRLRGCRAVRQVPGIESVEAVCRAGASEGWRHYFLGGAPGVAAALGEEMARRVPGLRIAGAETPPFRPLMPQEVEAMHERIRASGAHVVWVGLGAPKQELFMAAHAAHWPGAIAMGVGAAFDVNTGRLRRAPRALRLIGLEWAYRLALEPRRLWSRYAVAVPRLIAIAARTLVEDRAAGRSPAAPPRRIGSDRLA